MEISTLSLSAAVGAEPTAAFDAFVEELAASLERRGLRFEPGVDGCIVEGELEVGRVLTWEPPGRAVLRWRGQSWNPEAESELEIRCEEADRGSRLTLELSGFGEGLAEHGLGWFAREAAGALLQAAAPAALGDWLTDRWARRPTGAFSRDVYRDPLYHRPSFLAILETLQLAPEDRLLDIGCGGGAFLEEALKSGCRAAGIDHSEEMIRVARGLNTTAIEQGRLELVQADAARLPFADDSFTAAVSMIAFGFFPDPLAVLRECRRVLRPGGRLVIYATTKELKGTPAAPEPVASRVRFYEDDELEQLAREAGFAEATVTRPDLTEHARRVGVPEEHIASFGALTGGRPASHLLLARLATAQAG
jgi:SAM-dependent methyltransferase